MSVAVGLYAFIECNPVAYYRAIQYHLVASVGRAKAPYLLQLVSELPRRADGSVRVEVLQLVAMNQLDQIDTLVVNEDERRIIAQIIADRRNLRDRFTF